MCDRLEEDEMMREISRSDETDPDWLYYVSKSSGKRLKDKYEKIIQSNEIIWTIYKKEYDL